MRLPLTPNVSTKNGQSNSNARLTNCLKETSKHGDKAVIRPGLVSQAEGSGIGGGLVAFNNELVSVYGTTLGFSHIPAAAGSTDQYSATFDPYGSGLGLQGATASDGTNVIVGVNFQPTVVYKSTNYIDFSSAFSGFLGPGSGFPIVGYGNGYYWLFIANGPSSDIKLYRSDTTATSFTLVHTFLNASLPASHGNPFFWFSGSDMYVMVVGLSATYRFVSSDNGVTWSSATTVADIYSYGSANGQWQVIQFGSSMYTTMIDVSGQSHIVSTDDNFATISYGAAFGDTGGSLSGFSYIASISATLYRFYSSGSHTVISYDSSSDGITWSFEGILFTHATGKVCTLKSGTNVNGNIVLYVTDALSASPFTTTPYVLFVTPGSPGSIPALSTISAGHYDFAQSPL